MLIKKVVENGGGEGKAETTVDHSLEYRTAKELLDMMAKDRQFTRDADNVTKEDLVLLYKNIEIGTKLPDVNETKICRANQRVENVVHIDGDDTDESDDPDVCSRDDLHSIFKINNERLELLNATQPSIINTLCHKCGDLEMQSPGLGAEYEKFFLFHDPYIKQQLKSLKCLSTNSSDFMSDMNGLLAPSLLDYISCKRLENNYNFYMDNIIRYVQNTIDQLKRISNGDYLTDKTKEEWRKVEIKDKGSKNTKVLTTSTSIPLHIERKKGGTKSTWDDIVHSEVDLRSLSKILEKKIVLQIPKALSNSYTFLSNCSTDNIIISCKKDEKTKDKESVVNVVFQLLRDESGQIISNINSVMILQNISRTESPIEEIATPLSLPAIEIGKESEKETYNERNTCELTDLNDEDINVRCTDVADEVDDQEDEGREDDRQEGDEQEGDEREDDEQEDDEQEDDEQEDVEQEDEQENDGQEDDEQRLESDNESEDHANKPADDDNHYENDTQHNNSKVVGDTQNKNDLNEEEYLDCDTYVFPDDSEESELVTTSYKDSSEWHDTNTDVVNSDTAGAVKNVSPYDVVTPGDLLVTIQKLTKQGPLIEETEEVPQPTIKKKSPTRFRIKSPYENKSHYLEEKKRNKLLEIRERREKNKKALAEKCKSSKHVYTKGSVMPQSSSSVTKLSITNKSFYDSIYGQKRPVSTELKPSKTKIHRATLKREVLDVALPSVGEDTDQQSSTTEDKKYTNKSYYLDETETEMMYIDRKEKQQLCKDVISLSTSESAVSNEFNITILTQLIDPTKSEDNKETKEIIPQIDTLGGSHDSYSKTENTLRSPANMVPTNSPNDKTPLEFDKNDSKKGSSPIECRKSIDKIYELLNKLEKHQQKEKENCDIYVPNVEADSNSICQGSDSGTSLKHHVPSVTDDAEDLAFDKNEKPKHVQEHKKNTTTKSRTHSSKEKDKRKENSGIVNNLIKASENPLKAISQLLHNFENVQKNRRSDSAKQKTMKRSELPEDRNNTRTPMKYRSRLDQHNDSSGRYSRTIPPKKNVTNSPTNATQQSSVDNKTDKSVKKKINDILDEVKEARGEAVRGPSKFNSRLNTLAQPKKAYVQAHSEEYQTKYGRNLMADRLRRLATVSPTERSVSSAHSRSMPRKVHEPFSTISVRSSAQAQPIDHFSKPLSAGSNKNEKKESQGQPGKICLSIKLDVPESPESLRNKKMLAVKPYAKQHGHTTSPVRAWQEPSLVNLYPVSNNTSSSEMIGGEDDRFDSIINNLLINCQPKQPLHPLSKCHDRSTMMSNENMLHDRDDQQYTDDGQCSKYYQDTCYDEMTDKNEVAVGQDYGKTNEIQPFQSVTDQETLEQALKKCLSAGTFQKHLRMKNITLTPKQSMQKYFLLQSGDKASLVLDTSLSQSMRIKDLNSFTRLKSLPKPHLDWNFTEIPMQIATIGYVMPQHDATECARPSIVQLFHKCDRNVNNGQAVNMCFQNNEYIKNEISSPRFMIPNNGQGINMCFQNNEYIENEITSPRYMIPNNGQGENMCLQNNEYIGNEIRSPRYMIPNRDVYMEPENELGTRLGDAKHCQTPATVSDLQSQNTNTRNSGNTDKLRPEQGVDLTKSLDVLVELLNEIQNITTCQTNLTKQDNLEESKVYKDLKTVLRKKSPIELNNISNSIPYDLISLDRLHQIESSQSRSSLSSVYLCDKDKLLNRGVNLIPELRNIEKALYNTACEDKEVNVDFVKQCIDQFTDVPSIIFPIMDANQNSNKGSSQTVISECYPESSEPPREFDIVDLPVQPEKTYTLRHTSESKSHTQMLKTEQCMDTEKKSSVTVNSSYCAINSKFDPIMKIKRDVLVTVYSVLVFTVFAALSFPQLMYNV